MFLGVWHTFLSHKHLPKREGKIVDQLQHTSDLGSLLWTLRNSAQDFRKDQKRLTFRTNCSINSHTFKLREIIESLSPTFLSGAKLFGHVQQLYHTLYCVVWLVNTLTSTMPIGSPIVSTWATVDICEQWARNITDRFIRLLWDRNPGGSITSRCSGKWAHTHPPKERLDVCDFLCWFKLIMLPPADFRLAKIVAEIITSKQKVLPSLLPWSIAWRGDFDGAETWAKF